MNKWNNKIHYSDCVTYFTLFLDDLKSSRNKTASYMHENLLVSLGLEF
jgi:hypothetical protein